MARSPISRGTCLYCGHETSKNMITKHLQSCPARKERREQAALQGQPENLYHLRVEDAYDKRFWLHLEVRGSTRLKQIDAYLRDIWLECCGHLSAFRPSLYGGEEFNMRRKVDSLFEPGQTITHIYDFGTSSVTTLTSLAKSTGVALNTHPLSLMARNLMPEAICMECDQPATHFCMACLYEDEGEGLLCDEHLADHPHTDEDSPVALANSPRLGMCGYGGPAEPPYV
jgi:hypothetical protein